jgi:hypothetical protein
MATLTPLEAIQFCKQLKQTMSLNILHDVATTYWKRHNKHQYFAYYKIFARTQGQPNRITKADLNALRPTVDEELLKKDLGIENEIQDFIMNSSFVRSRLPFAAPQTLRELKLFLAAMANEMLEHEDEEMLENLF